MTRARRIGMPELNTPVCRSESRTVGDGVQVTEFIEKFE